MAPFAPLKYCENRNVRRSSIIPIVKLENSNYWLLNNFKDYEDTNDPILGDFFTLYV